MNLFVMNTYGCYFEVNANEITLDKDALRDCQFFDTEELMFEAVCEMSGCTMEEIKGTAFFITVRHGEIVMIDDRGHQHEFSGATEDFISDFEV